MMTPYASSDEKSPPGDSSPPPGRPPGAVGDDVSTLSNVRSFRRRKTSFIFDSIKTVVFRSHDSRIDHLLLSKMYGTHDFDLTKTTARDWHDVDYYQDYIIENIRSYITEFFFQENPVDSDVQEMFSSNLYFGETNIPNQGSDIYLDRHLLSAIKKCDFEQSAGLLIIWVRHKLFFPTNFPSLMMPHPDPEASPRTAPGDSFPPAVDDEIVFQSFQLAMQKSQLAIQKSITNFPTSLNLPTSRRPLATTFRHCPTSSPPFDLKTAAILVHHHSILR
jgi:hypothetical protein